MRAPTPCRLDYLTVFMMTTRSAEELQDSLEVARPQDGADIELGGASNANRQRVFIPESDRKSQCADGANASPLRLSNAAVLPTSDFAEHVAARQLDPSCTHEVPTAQVGSQGLESPAVVVNITYKDVFSQFILLGWIAFGGPAAHLALFQKVFVTKLQWITDAVFLELIGLSQCLPGPSSTQVSFALGIVKKGVPGGLLSGLLFQYPGLLIAALAGAGVAKFLRNPAPWLKGLLAGLASVGVALIASAAKSLTCSTCKDKITMTINAVATVISFYLPVTWVFPALILAGGLTTLIVRWNVSVTAHGANQIVHFGVGLIVGAILVLLWAATLAVVMTLRRQKPYEGDWRPLYWFEAFFRTGSIIFGGGQVVLPLLQNEVVATGWISLQDYLTGFAMVQAMPGPLFNIAAYLGAIIAYNARLSSVGGIFNCWIGLFAPGIMLIYGVIPWWGKFRELQVYQRLLPGANASAVGLIVSAVLLLSLQIYKESPFPTTSICIGIIGFSAVDFMGCPPPLVVLLGAVCGVIGWAAGMK